MAQCGNCIGLALAPPLQLRIRRDMLGQHLDGDGAIQASVAGFVDLAHAPCAEGGFDLIGAESGAGFQRHAYRLLSNRNGICRRPGRPFEKKWRVHECEFVRLIGRE